MQIRYTSAVAAAVLLTAPVTAQDKPASPLIDALARCLDIRDDTQRLACTDLAARRLVDASRNREVVVVDKDEVKRTRRSLFGFALPRIALFGRDGPEDAEEVRQIDSKILSVSNLGHGKLGFTLEDGSRWSTTEAWANAIPPKAGAILTVKRASLGSYTVSTKGSRTVRAMRVG